MRSPRHHFISYRCTACRLRTRSWPVLPRCNFVYPPLRLFAPPADHYTARGRIIPRLTTNFQPRNRLPPLPVIGSFAVALHAPVLTCRVPVPFYGARTASLRSLPPIPRLPRHAGFLPHTLYEHHHHTIFPVCTPSTAPVLCLPPRILVLWGCATFFTVLLLRSSLLCLPTCLFNPTYTHLQSPHLPLLLSTCHLACRSSEPHTRTHVHYPVSPPASLPYTCFLLPTTVPYLHFPAPAYQQPYLPVVLLRFIMITRITTPTAYCYYFHCHHHYTFFPFLCYP